MSLKADESCWHRINHNVQPSDCKHKGRNKGTVHFQKLINENGKAFYAHIIVRHCGCYHFCILCDKGIEAFKEMFPDGFLEDVSPENQVEGTENPNATD